MSTTSYLLWFVAMAIATNVIIYDGMTWTYFMDKHRVDPPKPTEARHSSDLSMTSDNHRHHQTAA